ncbi:MAG TPA: PD-(D/E)XK nuclease family protein, partial [Pyrinomonadaceae bacterium]|nr:PD-(D/E)XK nuclease family protein [Pyrinomonadaceae bacterium]
SGKADLVGDDYVLDFKTDSEPVPVDHAVQLWAYAFALDKPKAYIAYLRQQKLHEYTADQLSHAKSEAKKAVGGIATGNFVSTPTESGCRRCPYCVICDERHKN